MSAEVEVGKGLHLKAEQVATAMKSPDHLKAWLEASGRRYILLDARELVDALPWPNGHDALLQVLAAYRDHRRCIGTGRFETQVHPVTREKVEVEMVKGETLEPEELDRAIRYLVGQMMAVDPSWSLENPQQ